MLQTFTPLRPPLKNPPQYWQRPCLLQTGRRLLRYSASLASASLRRIKSATAGSSGHAEKAALSISCRLAGRAMSEREMQLWKAFLRITRSRVESLILSRCSQPLKAPSRISVTLSGSSTLMMRALWKASAPILMIPSGIRTYSL